MDPHGAIGRAVVEVGDRRPLVETRVGKHSRCIMAKGCNHALSAIVSCFAPPKDSPFPILMCETSRNLGRHSHVDDVCLSRVRYPNLSVILERFRRKFMSGSFCYKIDLQRCFSHLSVLPRDAPAGGAALMLFGFAFGLRASEMAAIRMMS